MKIKVSFILAPVLVISSLYLSGCSESLSGEGPEYYTTAFQCDHKHSKSGWCFSTPSKIYSSDYKLIGKGTVQEYLVPNGKLCVANTEGCITVNVEITERR